MTPHRVAAVCALVALSAGVAVNVTFLQRGTTAIWAIRGAFQPDALGANPESQHAISADPSDATVLGVG
ncbi:MAG TPA: hypothetical protein VE665_00565, partial [Hyphomicrobiaceae bacterium]|nr:hypothetical protein [Hyphomicrobiaceae bacterium]